MKSVLIAIQPYWVFLIIAKIMGWEIDQEKTVEVRKSFPKDLKWNRKSIIYCSKNKQSFNRIPKKYQPLMERFLGRVIGDFVCDKIDYWKYNWNRDVMHIGDMSKLSCVPVMDLMEYLDGIYDKNGNDKYLYAWHITDLVIYDKPKELGEFWTWKKCNSCKVSGYESSACCFDIDCKVPVPITRPPQSWGYVEELGV